MADALATVVLIAWLSCTAGLLLRALLRPVTRCSVDAKCPASTELPVARRADTRHVDARHPGASSRKPSDGSERDRLPVTG